MYDVRACFPLYACISVFCVDSTAWNGFSFHTFITQANILASWCTIRLYETAYMLRGDVFETMCTTHWHIRITTLYVAHQNQYTRRSYVNTHYAANANYGFHVHMCLHTLSLSHFLIVVAKIVPKRFLTRRLSSTVEAHPYMCILKPPIQNNRLECSLVVYRRCDYQKLYYADLLFRFSWIHSRAAVFNTYIKHKEQSDEHFYH